MTVLMVALGASAGLLNAQQTALPTTLGGWTGSEPQVVTGAQIPAFAAGNAALLAECGILAIERRTYSAPAGAAAMTLYRFRDSTGAYSALRFIAGQPQGAAAPAGYRRVMLVGHFVFEAVSANKAVLDGGVKALMAALELTGDPTPYPTLDGWLPEAGQVAGSQRYLLGTEGLRRVMPILGGDWVGFSHGAEGAFAEYSQGGRKLPLLVAAYPTPQAAMAKERELARWFTVNGNATATPPHAPLTLRRIQSVIAITPGNDAAARALLEQVRYEQILTVNEPGHRATDHPVIFYIYSIFVSTGVLLAFAFVAGIAFGGVRIVAKRFFPGRFFDRPGQMEIIQLGLASKPIEAKDFY